MSKKLFYSIAVLIIVGTVVFGWYVNSFPNTPGWFNWAVWGTVAVEILISLIIFFKIGRRKKRSSVYDNYWFPAKLRLLKRRHSVPEIISSRLFAPKAKPDIEIIGKKFNVGKIAHYIWFGFAVIFAIAAIVSLVFKSHCYAWLFFLFYLFFRRLHKVQFKKTTNAVVAKETGKGMDKPDILRQAFSGFWLWWFILWAGLWVIIFILKPLSEGGVR